MTSSEHASVYAERAILCAAWRHGYSAASLHDAVLSLQNGGPSDVEFALLGAIDSFRDGMFVDALDYVQSALEERPLLKPYPRLDRGAAAAMFVNFVRGRP